jgi:NADH:ubiquinone oxidoreductase subunit 5 (subunit L)/multisubunit Na+/H+ antiporter MnhA subunit
MAYKILAGIVAAGLLLVYMAPVVLKLKDTALWIVAGIGIVMMLVDLWQSLQKDD